MAEMFKIFYIDHVPRQQNAHADALAFFTASLAFSAGTTEKVLVYSHDLYWQKFAFEECQTLRGGLQVEDVLETTIGPELRFFVDRVLDVAMESESCFSLTG